MRLYVDVDIRIDSAHFVGERTESFGPFLTRESAEKCLIAAARRENAMGAMIRDPNT